MFLGYANSPNYVIGDNEASAISKFAQILMSSFSSFEQLICRQTEDYVFDTAKAAFQNDQQFRKLGRLPKCVTCYAFACLCVKKKKDQVKIKIRLFLFQFFNEKKFTSHWVHPSVHPLRRRDISHLTTRDESRAKSRIVNTNVITNIKLKAVLVS